MGQNEELSMRVSVVVSFLYIPKVYSPLIKDICIEVKVVDIGSSIVHREFDRRVMRIQVVDEIL